MSESRSSLDETTEHHEDRADDSERLHGALLTSSRGQIVLHPSSESYHGLIELLMGEGYNVCVDLCGADHLGNETRVLPSAIEPERFELVVNLLDVSARRRIRIRVQISETNPFVATISDIHPGAEAMEREPMTCSAFVSKVTLTPHQSCFPMDGKATHCEKILPWEGSRSSSRR